MPHQTGQKTRYLKTQVGTKPELETKNNRCPQNNDGFLTLKGNTNDLRTRMGSRRSVRHRHPDRTRLFLGGGMTLTINNIEWRMTPFAVYRNGKRVHRVPLYVHYRLGLEQLGEALL